MRRIHTTIVLGFLLLMNSFAWGNDSFDNDTDWQNGLTTTDALLSVDYSSLAGNGVLDEVTGLPPQAWGTLVVGESGFDPVATNPIPFAVTGFEDSTPVGIVFDASSSIELNIAPVGGGILEGFSITVNGPFGVDISIIDDTGATVDSYSQVGAPAAGESPEDTFFGWINCNGDSISKVVITPPQQVDFNAVVGGQFAFLTSDTGPSCRDQLSTIIAGLESIYGQASADDQYWIDWAIYDLTCANDDNFWQTDDRLSNQGTCFFGFVFYATYDLECVSDRGLVEEFLVDIQDLLSCVVDNEIDFALSNGGSDNLIAYADFFEDYADLYADVGLFLHAVILHFYAWLFAFWA